MTKVTRQTRGNARLAQAALLVLAAHVAITDAELLTVRLGAMGQFGE